MTAYDQVPFSAIRPRLAIRPFNVLLFFAAVGLALIAWRFAVGLGASTALSDGYPWGLWIAFDVVTGTALACGGYAMALLVYIFNNGRYHPLVRPAILTSALGYTIGLLSVGIDVGRPWLLWKVPSMVWEWNGNSALLEVAVCIMSYVVVLWLELAPVFLVKFKDASRPGLRRFAERTLPFFDKGLIWLIGLGMILPTMHQSSLGSLMLIAGPRLHVLWSSAFLPIFFLGTCIAMGYAAVVFESVFSARTFGRTPPLAMLRNLGKIAGWISLGFVFFRFVDLGFRGGIDAIFALNLYASMFWIETVLFAAPFFLLMRGSGGLGTLMRAAMLVALAGAVYRFDTFLVALQPGEGWHYFPSVTEQLITLGLVAAELAAYVAIVRYFPILGGVHPEPSTGTAGA